MRWGLGRQVAFAAVVLTLASACTASHSTPSNTAPGVPASGAGATTSRPTLTPTAAPTPTPTPSPALTPPPPDRITWTKLQGAGFGRTNNLFGWSGGYVTFTWDFASLAIVPEFSTDAVAWTAGHKLDMGAFAAGLTEWRKEIAKFGDPNEASCSLDVDNFAVGPSGLLVTAWLSCEGTCGPDWIGPATWVSRDGIGWDAVQSVGGIPKISGGSSGFIAIGDSATSVFTSKNGARWTASARVPLPTAAKDVSLKAVAAFSGGFVVAGSLRFDHACGYAFMGETIKAGIWWSADGSTWTLVKLTTSLTCKDATISLDRLSDHMLLARETCLSDESGGGAWTSMDGRTWREIPDPGAIANHEFFTDGVANVGHAASPDDPHPFCRIDQTGKVTFLTQAGDAPVVESAWARLALALGPAGLLATVDGSRFWLGTVS